MSQPSAIRKVMGKLYALWMGFAHLLGFVTQPIFFFIVFVVGFGPIGLFWKLIGNDPLDRRMDSEISCWKDSPGGNQDIEGMLKQF